MDGDPRTGSRETTDHGASDPVAACAGDQRPLAAQFHPSPVAQRDCIPAAPRRWYSESDLREQGACDDRACPNRSRPERSSSEPARSHDHGDAGRQGIANGFLAGLMPLDPANARFVATAYTIRALPTREDLLRAVNEGTAPNLHRQAMREVAKGQAIVTDCGGDRGISFFGELISTYPGEKGVAAIVTDAGIADVADVAATGLPVFCQGSAPIPGPRGGLSAISGARGLHGGHRLSRRCARRRCQRGRGNSKGHGLPKSPRRQNRKSSWSVPCLTAQGRCAARWYLSAERRNACRLSTPQRSLIVAALTAQRSSPLSAASRPHRRSISRACVGDMRPFARSSQGLRFGASRSWPNPPPPSVSIRMRSPAASLRVDFEATRFRCRRTPHDRPGHAARRPPAAPGAGNVCPSERSVISVPSSAP